MKEIMKSESITMSSREIAELTGKQHKHVLADVRNMLSQLEIDSAKFSAEYNINPMGKPRMTRADKWKKRDCVLRYRAFCDEVRLHKVTIPPFCGHIIFYLPMPKSWSQKKKAEMNGKPHKQKPDIDNLCKALLDAVFEDDSHIDDIRISKKWSDKGKISVNI